MKKLFTFLLLTLFSTSINAQAVKKVLLEEFTTSLCGFCPPKSHEILGFYESNLATMVFMTQHAGFGTDSMTNTAATTFASYFQPTTFGFAPAILIDRALYPAVDSVPYMTVDGFDTIAQTVAMQTPVAEIGITGTYEPVSRQLSITISTTFLQTVASYNRNVSVFLVEDSVIGTGFRWDQKCYDASWANTHYPGQYNATSQEILQYPHRHAQRAALNGTWGNASIIPVLPVTGTPYDLVINYTLPSNFNAEKCKLVAFVANQGPDKFNKQVLNVEEAWLNTFPLPTGISDIVTPASINSIYPNPASGLVNIDVTIPATETVSLKLTDITGREVFEIEPAQTIAMGRHITSFNTSTLPAGTYFVMLHGTTFRVHQKLVVY